MAYGLKHTKTLVSCRIFPGLKGYFSGAGYKSGLKRRLSLEFAGFDEPGSVELKLFLPRKKYLRLWKVRRECKLSCLALELFQEKCHLDSTQFSIYTSLNGGHLSYCVVTLGLLWSADITSEKLVAILESSNNTIMVLEPPRLLASIIEL